MVKNVLRVKEEEFDSLEKNLRMEMLKGDAELNKIVITPDNDKSNIINQITEKSIDTGSEDELSNIEEFTPLISAEDISARTDEACYRYCKWN